MQLNEESNKKIEEKMETFEGWNITESIVFMAVMAKTIVSSSNLSKDDVAELVKQNYEELEMALNLHSGQADLGLTE